MIKTKNFYDEIHEQNKIFESRKQDKNYGARDEILHAHVKGVISLFKECKFVGFNPSCGEAQDIISKTVKHVLNNFSEKSNLISKNYYLNLYLELCYLEKALMLIINEYAQNLPVSLKYIENTIYDSTDSKNLLEVSRNIGRKLINKELHSDFKTSKQHINEQLVFLKKEKELKIKIIESPTDINKTNTIGFEEELNMTQRVENAFGFMTGIDPRKHKPILNDSDFQNLVKWITYYFDNNFRIPKNLTPIKNVNTNKGNVIYTFIRFFKAEHPEKTRPDSLFELIKACFDEYRNDKISNMKKTKEPQYYCELISKKE